MNEINAKKLRNELLPERKERLNGRKVTLASEKPKVTKFISGIPPSLSRPPREVSFPSSQSALSQSPRKMMTSVDIKERAMASIHADNVDQKVERSNDPGRTSSLFVVNSGLEMGSDAKSRGSSILASDQWHGTIMKAYSDFMDISNPVPETKMDPKKTRKEATEELKEEPSSRILILKKSICGCQRDGLQDYGVAIKWSFVLYIWWHPKFSSWRPSDWKGTSSICVS